MGGLTNDRDRGLGMVRSTPRTVRRRSGCTSAPLVVPQNHIHLLRTAAATISRGRGAASILDVGSLHRRIEGLTCNLSAGLGHGDIEPMDREAAVGLDFSPYSWCRRTPRTCYGPPQRRSAVGAALRRSAAREAFIGGLRD